MKAVLDTMLWVSYTTAKDGYRYRLIKEARRRRVRLFTSEYILSELEDVLVEYLHRTRRYASLAEAAVLRVAKLVEIAVPGRRYVAADPDDDPIVQTALRARAHYLVTADAALLRLQKINSIRILSPRQFETKLRTEA